MTHARTILDFGNGFFLRQATQADRPALRKICLETGDAGEDATAREDDPDLIGDIYAVPYQVFEPDFAFVIDGPGGTAGYLLGAPDTASLYARLAEQWYPALQRRVTDPGSDAAHWKGSDWARHRIHNADLTIPPALAAFPSHGHIDLLPPAQGKGIGRRCMAYLEQRLAEAGSAGLWLEVHPRNLRAQRFYTSLGYERVPDVGTPDQAVYFGKRSK
ncbi:GNAT family N-acetyltransferase [Mesorhizobium sp. LHD-90]|uniref:GNAT family N-acetyltransferase n=1 Tax=Mesorhizobium sp. LHD-90 TaxID=3071414 RepID=UPI0027DEE1C2|nr:GNAT family N-acetyltransferase [Mesorhizobium sp. LHD-90]MDQ6432685.1 GNAT family N-acetyltransferase [Mesorhizobium sp. LHD-90]